MADYIERQAALHAVNEFFHDPKVDIALNAVPAANVREDVQGEWLPNIVHINTGKPQAENYQMGWKCSVCGRIEFAKQPFCNCGARMAGGGER